MMMPGLYAPVLLEGPGFPVGIVGLLGFVAAAAVKKTAERYCLLHSLRPGQRRCRDAGGRRYR